MKNYLLLLNLLFLATLGMGQIVLDQTDLPQPGDSQLDVVLSESQSSTVSPGGSGGNQIWDFSFLIDNWQHAEGDYLIPSNTPNGSFFPTATIAVVHDESIFEYFVSDNNGMRYLGYDIDGEITTFDQLSYRIPIIAFGNTIQHTLRYRYNISSANTYDVVHIDLTSTADAWGTITTPVGTVNALRIYTTETFYDSSYVNGFGTQNSMIPGSYYYEWFTKNLGWPVLSISDNKYFKKSDSKTVMYSSDLSGANIISDFEDIKKNEIFPNPASDIITLKIEQNINAELTLNIYNMYGTSVKTEILQSNNKTINVGDLCNGVYFVEIKSKDWTEKQKLIIQR